LALGTVLTI